MRGANAHMIFSVIFLLECVLVQIIVWEDAAMTERAAILELRWPRLRTGH